MKKRCGFRFIKRLLSVALAAALVFQLFGLPVLALGASDTVGSSGCTHVHNEYCGHIQAEEGTPCKHELGQHDETCGYSERNEEIPCDMDCEGDAHAEGCTYRPAQEGTPCGHTEHDENCGYVPAVEGASCNHTHDESCGGLPAGISAQTNTEDGGTGQGKYSISGGIRTGGKPVFGTTVELYDEDNNKIGLFSSLGDYSFKNLDPGTYTVKVPAGSYGGVSYKEASETVTIIDSDERVELTLKREQGNYSIDVSISLAGSTKDDLIVWLYQGVNKIDSAIASGSSPGLGNDVRVVSFDGLAPGTYTVIVPKGTYGGVAYKEASQTVTITDRNGSVDITLKRDSEQGDYSINISISPSVSAEVELYQDGNRIDSTTASVSSLRDARCSFGGLTPGNYTVKVPKGTHNGVTYQEASQSVTISDSQPQSIYLYLDPVKSHAVTMNTVIGGGASASATSVQEGAIVTMTAQPDENYDFIKWEIAPTINWMDGTDETSQTAKFEMPLSDVAITPVFVKTKYSLSGTVTLNGGPVKGAALTLYELVGENLSYKKGSTSGEDGSFIINGLSPGKYMMDADKVGHSKRLNFEVTDADLTDMEFSLESVIAKGVEFTGLLADGSVTETTTKLTLSFDTSVNFDTDAVIITGDRVTVKKGNLQADRTGTKWTLNLTDVQITGGGSANITVDVNLPDKYALSPKKKNVTIYQAPTVTVPGAPTGLKAEAGDKQVKLTWTAPASDGGSEITRYEVSMNGGTWKATGGTTTTYTVTGLTNGTEYTFQVRAVNGKGAGAASNEVKATPAAATYTLTVINGTDSTNKGPYIKGARVSIKADNAPAGYRFDKWVPLGGGRFENDQSAETIFIMPGADVKIEAIFIKKTDPGHSHTFDSTWSFDGNSHWHACTAGDGARSGQAAHTASNWMIDKPATETEAGSQYKECTVCHYVLLRETIAPTGPTYSLHTLEDPDTGVKVSGYFTNDAVLVVKDRLLHAKNTCDVCDDIRARQDKGELIVLYDISLSSGSYAGDLDVQIPVDAKYNGQTVLLLHCKDKVLESRTVTVENGVAKGTFSSLSPFAALVQPSGTTTITGLPNDYTLLVGQSVSWTPAPAGGAWSCDKDLLSMAQEGDTYTFKALKTGKATATYTVDGVPFTVTITINDSTIPQTGDTASPLPWLLAMLAALLGGASLLFYRKRRYTKRHG